QRGVTEPHLHPGVDGPQPSPVARPVPGALLGPLTSGSKLRRQRVLAAHVPPLPLALSRCPEVPGPSPTVHGRPTHRHRPGGPQRGCPLSADGGTAQTRTPDGPLPDAPIRRPAR